MQEQKILERLSYDENVVQFYGSYIQEGDVLLVLEYMEVCSSYSPAIVTSAV